MTLTETERLKIQQTVRDNSVWIPFCGCWLWVLGRDSRGYGCIKINKVEFNVHRLSYAAFKQDFDDELCVLHTCDTPLCVNPDHLWLGSNRDNMLDAHRKGRLHFNNPQKAHNAGVKGGANRTKNTTLAQRQEQGRNAGLKSGAANAANYPKERWVEMAKKSVLAKRVKRLSQTDALSEGKDTG